LTLLAALLWLAAPQDPAEHFAAYGRETLRQIQREFYLPQSHLYAESAEAKGPGKVSFLWPASVLLSAFDAAAAYDEKFKPALEEYAKAVHGYWNEAGPTPGFSVLPNQPEPDRYYDDNEWMVLALGEAGVVLKDKALSNQARDALKFVLSGQDQKLGGGIYWREREKTSKNTCSNAPAIAALLYAYDPKPTTTEFQTATTLYNWTVKTLRDPETGLYWDNVKLDGAVDRAFFSYNSALMIDANALIARATGSFVNAERARVLELASAQRWIKPDGAVADDGVFASKLVESFLVRMQAAPEHGEQFGRINQLAKVLQRLHDRGGDRNGHYPKRWDADRPKPLDKWDLIDQAAAARAYFLLALFIKNRTTPMAGL
jgi:hypothetical protein